jgi:hypothetical protein
MPERKRPPPKRGTTRSPADRDLFGDDGPAQPEKDRPEHERQPSPSSDAGGVD